MLDPARLLGFAFANADLLFEIEKDLTISFMTGAASEFIKDGDLTGKPAGRLFEPSEGVKFATFVHAIGRGGRAGPIRLKLLNGPHAMVSFCHLPQNGTRISCTLARPGARNALASGPETDAKTGLSDRSSFLAAAQSMMGDDDALTLVDVPGLPAACAKMKAGDADKLLERIGGAIKGWGGKAVARLGESRFGAIGPMAQGNNRLGERIRAALRDGGLDLPIEEALISLKAQGLSPEHRIMALRYVVQEFSEGKAGKDLPADPAAAFEKLLTETENRALAFTKTVADGAFALAYQPIRDLHTNKLSHYEVLSRFTEGKDVGSIIRFAEALGISDALDLAVAARVFAVLEDYPNHDVKLAFNLSGQTLMAPAAFGMIAALCAKKRRFAERVLIEITETAELVDLPAANTAVQALRGLGYRVGLDDFGAGATSMQYLQALTVDYVKFDGSLIKKIGKSARDDMVLKGIVKLCAELGVETVAEWIETADQHRRTREMGFHLGQGYLLGEPAAEIAELGVNPAARPLKAAGARR